MSPRIFGSLAALLAVIAAGFYFIRRAIGWNVTEPASWNLERSLKSAIFYSLKEASDDEHQDSTQRPGC
jgi:hypothetical protein